MAPTAGLASSVVRVCLTTAFLMLGNNLVSPVLALYGQTFGVGVAVVGLLVSAFGAARLVVDLPGGHLADRLGSRRTMLMGCLVVAAAAWMAALAEDFPLLVLARALQGAGSALYMVAGYSFVGRVSPPHVRGRMMSYYQGSILVGQSLGPTVGGLAAERFGLASPFWFYGFLAGLAALLTVTAVPDVTRERELAREEDAPVSKREGQKATARLLARPEFVLACLVAFAIAYTRTGARGTVIPLLGNHRLGLREGQIGLALTVAALLNLALLVPTGRLVDTYGRKLAIVPGLLVSAVGLVMFATARSYPQYVLAAAVLGLGTGLAGPAPAAYVSDILPPAAFGASMGVYRTLMDVGMVAGPVVAGAAADLLGLPWALVVNAALMATTALMFAWKAPESLPARRKGPAVAGRSLRQTGS